MKPRQPRRQPLYIPPPCDIVVERIPQHRHCAECGKAMVGTEKYCSDECKAKRENLIRKKKRQLLMLYFGSFIAFAVVIVIWLWGA